MLDPIKFAEKMTETKADTFLDCRFKFCRIMAFTGSVSDKNTWYCPGCQNVGKANV